MKGPVQIADKTWWVGVNDRTTDLFEALWPLNRGISYNSYMVADEKVAVIDGVKADFYPQYVENLKAILGPDRTVDYMIVNHVEPDHSGAVEVMVQAFPDITVVGNDKTLKFLTQFYGPLPNFLEVKDGDVLDLGDHKLTFALIPMVHWPETMVSYDTSTKALFSCDAFGSFGALDGGVFDDQLELDSYRDETYRYYANIVGKYSSFVMKALNKIRDMKLDIAIVCPSHGPVYRKDPDYIIDFYEKMARNETDRAVLVVYGSMYGNTARLAEAVAEGVHSGGITDVTVRNSATADLSELVRDLWRCRGLILVGCSYNGGVFPKIKHFMDIVEGKKVSGRFVGICGSYTWSKGAAMKPMRAFAEQSCWTKVEPEVEVLSRPDRKDLEEAHKLGANMAEAVSKA
ncbi:MULTISPECIES: FprA family A-type flavoprotein [Dethiosulfovibrio]|jgi:flavorubredoxin|uniref:FprA family A-type flavoprotein n=2 Tax=Dethiosulfovibrio TaxID=47054 RepID=A0ABS9EMW9_9BACT|nr:MULTISPECIES: FprA family A-type flavoprotein [Dethiosulfovibrio]MCF4113326.1 FprA family A-type flavoprotein [Dethiosulfovibrio russensis]MCF4142536.1 FprA family A-type flavoprotein [Dethiosulfovibrio marinus]MCF4145824.1 FprA family A-type flavoprotein [Dethiosulfovibrio acidaminovorans]